MAGRLLPFDDFGAVRTLFVLVVVLVVPLNLSMTDEFAVVVRVILYLRPKIQIGFSLLNTLKWNGGKQIDISVPFNSVEYSMIYMFC